MVISSRSSSRSFLNTTTAFVLAGIIATSHSQAFAQAAPQAAAESDSGLEEIVVTAQRRSENLQTVPISVTAITSKVLETTGITDTLKLSQAVPSVQMTRSGSASIFFIRGVGNSSGGTGEEGANAFYIDGVYLSDLSQANAEFNNIERVEVLKGPQGTLFGRNSSGGLINIITKDPGQDFEMRAKAGYANYQTYKGQLYIAGPLSDTLAANLALTGRNQTDGWGRNNATGLDNQEGSYWAARSKLVWRPNDGAKLTAAGDYYHSRDNFATGFTLAPGAVNGGYTYAGPHNISTFSPNITNIRVFGLSLTGEFDVSDWGTLTSITAFRKLKQLSYVDSDYTPLRIAELRIPSFDRTFQQEVRLASAERTPFNWQVGIFFFRAHAGVRNQLGLGTALGGIGRGSLTNSEMRTQSYSTFGEAGYDITPTTHLTLGIRYTREDRSLVATVSPVNQVVPALITAFTLNKKDTITYGKFTYRAAIRQDIADGVNVYASFNRGFKAGLWALQSPAGPPVRPQITDAFEIGLKSELFDRMLRLNLAAFHYNVKDYQVRANPGLTTSPILLNATTVKVDGLEGEVVLQPSRELQVNASFTWLGKSKFGSFVGSAPFTYPNPATCNNVLPATSTPDGVKPGQTVGAPTGGNRTCFGSPKGNRTPLAPRFAASFGGRYTIPLGGESELSFNGLYTYNSGFFFELDNRARQPKYFLANGTIEYKINDRWSVELWGNNLTDKKVYITILGSGNGDHGELQAPRTYGVNVAFNF